MSSPYKRKCVDEKLEERVLERTGPLGLFEEMQTGDDLWCTECAINIPWAIREKPSKCPLGHSVKMYRQPDGIWRLCPRCDRPISAEFKYCMQCRRPNECYDLKKRARLEAALFQQAEVRASLRLKESLLVGGSQGNESQSSEIPENSEVNGEDENDDLIANVKLPDVKQAEANTADTNTADTNSSDFQALDSEGKDADKTDK